ncbi:MAG: RsmB/NOP family class I SAM-dependent RNA methyltransferase [Burkholderiaceae bacterium]
MKTPRKGQGRARALQGQRPPPRSTHRLDRLADLIASTEGFSQPADRLLSAYFLANAALGPRERGFLADGFYAAIRQWSAIEAQIEPTQTRWRRFALVSAALSTGLDRIVSEMTEGERAWLIVALHGVQHAQPIELRASLPEWIWRRWVDQLGVDEAQACAIESLSSAPLDLRVNLLTAQPESVKAELKAAGLEVESLTVLPEALRVQGRPSLSRTPAFLRGDFEVQDLGSQLLARLCAPRRGEFVVDFCAGAGGKTLALGALMRNTGRLYALDTSASRLLKLKPRLARSGLSNVWPIAISGLGDERLLRLAGKAGLVLVDAPCTGLGTLRRNPDLKWRQSEATLQNLMGQQAAILRAAARLVAPKGRLVYATCSTLREENEDQIAHFLAEHPDFEAEPVASVLSRGNIDLPQGWRPYSESGALRLWPHRTQTDGFFGVILLRKP